MTVDVSTLAGYVALVPEGVQVISQTAYVVMMEPVYVEVPETATDDLVASDTAPAVLVAGSEVADSSVVSDESAATLQMIVLLSDGSIITDALPEAGPVEITMVESTALGEVYLTGSLLDIEDVAIIEEDPRYILLTSTEIIEAIETGFEEVTLGRGVLVSQNFRVFSDDIQLARAIAPVLEETVELSPEWLASLGVIIRERVRHSELLTPGLILGVLRSEAVRMSEILSQAVPTVLADNVTIANAVDVLQALLVADRLGITSVVAGAGIHARTWRDTLRVSSTLLRFISGVAADDIELTDTLASQLHAIASLTESVEIEPVVSPTWLLRVDVDESVELTAEEVVSMLFQPELLEGIQIEAGYIAPNGSFTTWAMNARTAAVTEYRNYEFNSFAKLGDRYIAASADGLYELLGDDDDGDDIIARIVGGFMQFGGTKLSRLSAAYIAARGEGTFVLKIETADGEVYNYSVDTRDMRSTKFHMGKGQRARYFAFELISAGQDFDLDTLEFVPVVVQRRV